MTRRATRRTALRILAAGLAVPLGALTLRGLRGSPEPVRWQGEALGALSAMTLWHPSPALARRVIARMAVEIERLENIFSLYRPDSEISRLNRDGRLSAPSRDLLQVLDESRRIADLSGGAFDPTIQPLWHLHASGKAEGAAVERALKLVDYSAVDAARHAILLGRAGMALSLNGIAQGHITDRITELLGNEGFESAMIELGETRALGRAPDGGPFPVGLVNPERPGRLHHDIQLADAALSVSGGYGTRFDRNRHHIFDPQTGQSASGLLSVAVVAPRAVQADALSTAIYVAGEASAARLLPAYPRTSAVLTRRDGTTFEV